MREIWRPSTWIMAGRTSVQYLQHTKVKRVSGLTPAAFDCRSLPHGLNADLYLTA